ncbi:hypothetical protein [Paracoccus marcusii]|uniref:Uncharacterized protein n=1 Tax=Paracoccus marcusii TaxID=59779 RepID=A0ABY7UNY3_9RHOB|nr:hypothetical protein [Paracoccus marcusii]WDA11645.1 hypothetical protein PRL19_10065 [Paracoccus marcusii]
MTEDTADISINGVSHPILCGLCNTPIAYRGEADPDRGEVGCASCGNWADVKEAASIAIEYAKDEAQLAINRMAKEAARKSKFMTFKGQTSHNKSYRFVVGDLQI